LPGVSFVLENKWYFSTIYIIAWVQQACLHDTPG
jgi:hypothetical protein